MNISSLRQSPRPNAISMLCIAISLGALLLALLHSLNFHLVEDLVWAADLSLTFPGKYLLSLGISLVLATGLVYFLFRSTNFDRKLRAGPVIHTVSIMTVLAPILLASLVYYLAMRRNDVIDAAEALTSVMYQRTALEQITTWFALMTAGMLVVNNWFDLRITLQRRQRSG